MASVQDFKSKLIGGGARANQFMVKLNSPAGVNVNGAVLDSVRFLCKAASIPASTVDDIPLQYRGRTLHVAGERTFAPWTVSIYNDTTFGIRSWLENWSQTIQDHSSTFGTTTPLLYQANLEVHQLDRSGAGIRSYQFISAYPVEIGPIGLDYDQTNAIETFDVTFIYDYWINIPPVSDSGVSVTINTPVGSFPIPG
jgi:hypothetical protein